MKRPIYYLFTLSFLCLQSFSPNLFAIDTVSTVWRADTRDPNKIFRDGFHPRGTNNNLLQHALGDSLDVGRDASGRPDSRFISTSAHTSEEVFVNNVLDALYSDPTNIPSSVWVYEINPDEDFYNTEASLRFFLAHSAQQSLTEDNRETINTAIDTAELENEWVSLGAIPPQRIRGARLWRYEPTGENDVYGDPILDWRAGTRSSDYRENGRYDRGELHSNRNPYVTPVPLSETGTLIIDSLQILQVESPDGRFLSPGFCPEAVAGSSSTSSEEESDSCPDRYQSSCSDNSASERKKRETRRKQYCRLVNPREEMIKKLMPILFLNFKVNATETTPKKQKSKKPVHDEL